MGKVGDGRHPAVDGVERRESHERIEGTVDQRVGQNELRCF
jgi:hypothetical protein